MWAISSQIKSLRLAFPSSPPSTPPSNRDELRCHPDGCRVRRGPVRGRPQGVFCLQECRPGHALGRPLGTPSHAPLDPRPSCSRWVRSPSSLTSSPAVRLQASRAVFGTGKPVGAAIAQRSRAVARAGRMQVVNAVATEKVSVSDCFNALKAKGETALIPFLVAGDPDLETTIKALELLDEVR